MTFEEANKWINVCSYRDGTDDSKKHSEAVKAFNVIYSNEICVNCVYDIYCNLAEDSISHCNFFTEEES